MDILSKAIILLAALFILGKSADIVIKNLIRISSSLSWNKFVVAFVILGIATSTPELFVGINSALDGNTQLSLGNIMGATIVLIGLIIGGTAFFVGKVSLSNLLTPKEIFLMGGTILLPIFMLLDLELSRIDAIVCIFAYTIYMSYMYLTHTKHQRNHIKSTIEHINQLTLQKSILMFLVGFIGVSVSARLAVSNALSIAQALNIPTFIIGVLIFAIGTNLPELVLALKAIKTKNKNIVLGNVLGSATTNTLVISLASIINPTQVSDSEVFVSSAIFLLAIVAAFSYFIKTKNDISKEEGAILFGLYALFVVIEIATKIL
ncbi:MAG: sodium:calcium antiporter [Patescibacteria group bacterium]|nr:sodium:calcium antiporter [Patescibacteria group bacterium]